MHELVVGGSHAAAGYCRGQNSRPAVAAARHGVGRGTAVENHAHFAFEQRLEPAACLFRFETADVDVVRRSGESADIRGGGEGVRPFVQDRAVGRGNLVVVEVAVDQRTGGRVSAVAQAVPSVFARAGFVNVVGSRASEHDGRVARHIARLPADRAGGRAVATLPDVVEHLHVGRRFRHVRAAAVGEAVVGKQTQAHLFAVDERVVVNLRVVGRLVGAGVADIVGRTARVVIRFARHDAERGADSVPDDVGDVVVAYDLVGADHAYASLIVAGGAEHDVRSVGVVAATKDEVPLDRATRAAAEADAALAFEDGVVEDFVALGFDRDDLRFARGLPVRPPDGAVEDVALDGDLHVEGLDIAHADAEGFEAVVQIATRILRNRVARSEVAVAHLVRTRDAHPAFRGVGQEGDGGVADRVGALGQGAIFDGGIKPLDVDPLAVRVTCSAAVEAEVRQRHIARTRSGAHQVGRAGQNSTVRVEVQTGQGDAAPRKRDLGWGIDDHAARRDGVDQDRIVFRGCVVGNRALQRLVDCAVGSAVQLHNVTRVQPRQIVEVRRVVDRVSGANGRLDEHGKSERRKTASGAVPGSVGSRGKEHGEKVGSDVQPVAV